MAPFFERRAGVRAPGGGVPPCLTSPRSTWAPRAGAWSAGASTARVMSLEECHRFPNRPVRLPDGLRWNLLHLFTEAVERAARPHARRRRRRHLGRRLRAAGRAAPRARPPLPLPRRAHRGRRARRGLRDHRHPAHADQHRLPAAGRRSRRARRDADRAGARPARVLAVRRARQRAHERLDDRAAGRAHRRVGAAS